MEKCQNLNCLKKYLYITKIQNKVEIKLSHHASDAHNGIIN